MSDQTGISWTDATWNPVRGCSRVSAGCQNCYAEVQAARIVRMGKGKPTAYDGLVRVTAGGEPRWTGDVRLVPEMLAWPLRKRKPLRIFVNSMSDLFHERLTNEQIAAVFGVMAACPQHTYQVLTKRARRMREWFEWVAEHGLSVCMCEATAHLFNGINVTNRKLYEWWRDAQMRMTWPLPNVWLGVSVENQEAADERIPELLRTPAAVRWLSCEPLLGEVDVQRGIAAGDPYPDLTARIGWIVSGCESGPGARPCSVEWLRSLRDQCASAGVAFFLKQAVCEMQFVPGRGAVSTGIDFGPGSTATRRLIELPYLDGVQHAAFPEVSR